MLVAIEPETRPGRPLGMDRGKVIIRDDFDDPMPEFDPDYAHRDDPLRSQAR